MWQVRMTRTTVERLMVNVQRPAAVGPASGSARSRRPEFGPCVGASRLSRTVGVFRTAPKSHPSRTPRPGRVGTVPGERGGDGGRRRVWDASRNGLVLVRPPVDQERLLLPLGARHTNRTMIAPTTAITMLSTRAETGAPSAKPQSRCRPSVFGPRHRSGARPPACPRAEGRAATGGRFGLGGPAPFLLIEVASPWPRLPAGRSSPFPRWTHAPRPGAIPHRHRLRGDGRQGAHFREHGVSLLLGHPRPAAGVEGAMHRVRAADLRPSGTRRPDLSPAGR